jgi:hypothetical protein
LLARREGVQKVARRSRQRDHEHVAGVEPGEDAAELGATAVAKQCGTGRHRGIAGCRDTGADARPHGCAVPMGAAPFGVGGQPPPCVIEFGKLRDEVQKKGAAAKDASEHKVACGKICKIVQAYSAVEGNWLKFAEAGVSTCGIPREIVNQLKQVHARTEHARIGICAGRVRTDPSFREILAGSTPDSISRLQSIVVTQIPALLGRSRKRDRRRGEGAFMPRPRDVICRPLR